MERDAAAQQEKKILEAQAEAEAIRLKGESRAYAIEARAKVSPIFPINKSCDRTKLNVSGGSRKYEAQSSSSESLSRSGKKSNDSGQASKSDTRNHNTNDVLQECYTCFIQR